MEVGDSSIQKKNRIKKIISGGQSGVDIAALKAAKALGIETGGWMPFGFKTENGKKKDYASLYGVKQTKETDYQARTLLNIRDSDGTIIFGNLKSPGTALTLGLCKKHEKPYLYNPDFDQFKEWVELYNIETLNVAGNRESISPGIFSRVYSYLLLNLPLL